MIEREIDCDFVDINAACPLDQLHKKGCGSILSTKHRKLQQICVGMSNVLETKALTCKIRMMHFDNEPRLEAQKLIPKLGMWGVDGVVIHGRTARMRYSKEANWDYIRKCKEIMGREIVEDEVNKKKFPYGKCPTLIGCGDVLHYDEYD